MEATAKPSLAPPAARKTTKAPEPHEWPMRLRELPREWRVMAEDFGFTKGTIARYAEQARRGDKVAIKKLEPLRQFFLTLMGMTKHDRIVRHEEGESAGKAVMRGDGLPTTEERSVFGMRDGYDMVVEARARKPRPAILKDKVSEHFYTLCPLLEFLKRALPLKLHGQRHPNPEGFAEAHRAVTSGGCPDAKAFSDNDKVKAEFKRVLDATDDPARRDVLTLMLPYIVDSKQSEWDGLA